MKILKDNTAKTYTCKECKSVLEVSKSDLHTSYGDYFGYLYDTDYYYCPCCGAINYVK